MTSEVRVSAAAGTLALASHRDAGGKRQSGPGHAVGPAAQAVRWLACLLGWVSCGAGLQLLRGKRLGRPAAGLARGHS